MVCNPSTENPGLYEWEISERFYQKKNRAYSIAGRKGQFSKGSA